MAKRWHVVECYEGRDKDAFGRLAALGFEVWRPIIKVRIMARWKGTVVKGSARQWKIVPIFGNYLFANVYATDSVYNSVREQSGVRGWVCYAGSDEPAIVPDDVIECFKSYRPQAQEIHCCFGVGDIVRIGEGPFVGYSAKVMRVDSGRVVCVEMDIFGRPTPLIFPVGHVELVEHGRRPPIERDVKRRPRLRA